MNGNLADYVINSLMQNKGLALPPKGLMEAAQANYENNPFGLLEQIDAGEMRGNDFVPSDVRQNLEAVGGPVATGDISNKIQEWLGAKQPDEGNFPQQVLSKRFESQSPSLGPSFSDYSRAIQASAYGKPTGAQDFAEAGLKQQLDMLGTIGKLQKDTKESSGLFAGTGMDAQVYNILSTTDPSSREYQIAYNIATEPKTQVGADGTISVVKPNLTAFPKPTGSQPMTQPSTVLPQPNVRNINVGDSNITLMPSESTAKKTALDNEGKLRDDYLTQSKPFIVQRDAYSRIVESAKNPSPAGDLALIFNYMKVLDPGSTVREGEFATAQNSGSIDSRISAMYNKVLSGERLAPEMRADFLDRANLLYQGSLRQQQQNAKIFSDLATRAGVDPSNVAVDLNYTPDTGGWSAEEIP